MSRALPHTNTSLGAINPLAWFTNNQRGAFCHETDWTGEKTCSFLLLLAFLIFRKTEVSKALMPEGLKDHAWGSEVLYWEGSMSSPHMLGHRTTIQGGRCFISPDPQCFVFGVLCNPDWKLQALFPPSIWSLCPGFSQLPVTVCFQRREATYRLTSPASPKSFPLL